MGFFSDLKDDLSQAVNELMPEEELQEALSEENLQSLLESEAAAESAKAAQPQAEAGMPTSDDLSEMLDKMEALSSASAVEEQLPDEFLQEEPLMEAEMPVEEAVIPEEPVIEQMPVPEVAEPAVQQTVSEEIEIPQQDEERNEEKMEMEMQGNVVDETAVVTAGMTIVGDITSGGSLELIGNVTGNIDILGKLNVTGGIQGNSKAAEIYAEGARINGEINSGGSVKIGQSSVVIGNIFANSAVIAGAVKGDIDVHGPVVLDTSAIVMGNIKSKSVQINNGAVIEGMCSQCYADVNPTSFFEEIKKNKENKEAAKEKAKSK